MDTKEFIKAFDELSAEDQADILAELTAKKGSDESSSSCCSGPMKEQVKEMMGKMESSESPMGMCMEMMNLCREKLAGCST